MTRLRAGGSSAHRGEPKLSTHPRRQQLRISFPLAIHLQAHYKVVGQFQAELLPAFCKHWRLISADGIIVERTSG